MKERKGKAPPVLLQQRPSSSSAVGKSWHAPAGQEAAVMGRPARHLTRFETWYSTAHISTESLTLPTTSNNTQKALDVHTEEHLLGFGQEMVQRAGERAAASIKATADRSTKKVAASC